MKVIIAGSRTLNNMKYLDIATTTAFNSWISKDQDNFKYYMNPEIVSGGAQGIDFCAELYAKKHNFNFKEFLAEWDVHGKSAGYVRNHAMAQYADALIAIWDGKSKGTLNMINTMANLNKPIYVYCP